jgi:Transposase DDE domain
MDFDLEVSKRLPLAEAVLRLTQFALSDDLLNEIYESSRGRSYTRTISFPLFVKLIGDALIEHRGSGNQAFTRAIEQKELEATFQAIYGKLKRTPEAVSQQFLLQSTARLGDVFPSIKSKVPSCLRNYDVINIDGKKLKQLPKRLLPARKLKGNIFGGKLVVASDQQTGMAIAMNSSLDGEEGDQPLVPGLLDQIRKVRTRKRLYVEDRGFCDLVQPSLVNEDEDFLIRYRTSVSFYRDLCKEIKPSKDHRGRKILEEWGWLGNPDDPRAVYVRMITVYEDGEEKLSVVTSLLSSMKFPAADLLEVYANRWDIEELFQRVTEVYCLTKWISSTPQATIFQAAYCFFISNTIVAMRAFLANAQETEAAAVSEYQIQYDVRAELTAWSKMMNVEQSLELLGDVMTPKRLVQCLRRLASQAWSDRYIKAPSTKHTPIKNKRYIEGGHTSMQRLIDKDKSKRSRKRTC